MGGLVTLANPESLPEGASPRCQDNDYLVGSTQTRAGLTSAYTYSGASVGPLPGGSAVDTSLDQSPWSNPANVLLNTGVYATTNLTPLLISEVQIVNLRVSFVNFNSYAVVTFTSDPPAYIGQTYNFSDLTSYPGLNGLALVSLGSSYPGGALAANQQAFLLANSLSGFVYPAYGPAADTGTATILGTTLSGLSDGLDVTQFGLSIPSTSTPQGFLLSITAYNSNAAILYVQMLKAGVPVGNLVAVANLTQSPAVYTAGGTNSLFGVSWTYADLNSTGFGFRVTAGSNAGATVFVGYAALTIYLLPSQTNFNFITTFTDQRGTVRNLSEDAAGNLWVENVTSAPGQLTLAFTGITPNSYMTGITGEDVEYLSFNNGKNGSDIPRQYTSKWTDRITQVGPGAPPVFTPVIASSDSYNIQTIVQPPQMSDPQDSGHLQTIQWSQGPTSTAAGNIVTIFYSNAFTNAFPDQTLVNAFNSGQPVYVYMSSLPSPYVDGTYLVTSVGKAIPPGGSYVRWYFTYQVPTTAYNQIGGPDTATGYYQQTLATMVMAEAVPGLSVGATVTISGTTEAGYNNSWPISQTLNSGEMAITETSVTAGVATYTYSLASGVAPFNGQLVTVTGTTNANGALNVVNAQITGATGGSSGSFTVAVSAPNAPTAAESGQATTAGTVFAFDPGALTLGGMTSPIYGTATGGALTFAGISGQFIGPGTRQGTVFFITRNGYYTAPAPPVTFTCPNNTTGINAAQIPIGPPNVIARGIAFTEAGQNGVPGANFFTLPTQVQYIVENVTYTATSLIINDNTTVAATFFFTDSVLLQAEAIDIYGYNLFNQIEIGNPGWIVGYDSRNFYGLCQNKIQNFNNLSFDGGYNPAAQLQPLGWTTPDSYGQLLISPVFGNSYYIQNTTNAIQNVLGLIWQSAFQDAYQVPILSAQTAYSVRVTARCPSGQPYGGLIVDLCTYSAATGYGPQLGIYFLPCTSMTSSFAIYSGALIASTVLPTVPANLVLRVWASGLGAGGDVELDRVEVYPTDIPTLGTTVYGSYAGLPEQVDGVTGQGIFASENQQPVNGAVVMYDTFYGLKGQGPNASMYSWQASANLEPSDWSEPEVAQRAGACGPMAFDFGEQWIVMACRNGIYLYEGGQPGKIMQEIYQVWDAINWTAETTIWMKNDVTSRRLFIGIPLPTPNFWLPDLGAGEIATVSVSSGLTRYVYVTFSDVLPELIPGQNAVFNGLTNYPQLNGQTLQTVETTGNQISFIGQFSLPPQAALPDTGTVTPEVNNPTSPNVMLMLNYQGLDTGQEMKTSAQMHTTMFGTLNAIDMRRKWSLWTIPSPYANIVQTATDKALYICNGVGNSKVYMLDPTNQTDDGAEIPGLYTTAGLPNDAKRTQIPQLGDGNVRIGYMNMTCDITGTLQVRYLPNILLGPNDPTTGYNPWTVPGGFSGTGKSLWNRKSSVNFFCTRAFVEISGAIFNLSALSLRIAKDVWNAPWGVK